MSIAVDANVLVYAHRRESPRHAAAVERLKELAGAPRPVAIPWTVVYQFLRVVTHARVFDPPSSLDMAWRFCEDVFSFPGAMLLAETERHAEVLGGLLAEVSPRGNLVHDAHIAAVMLEHGVRDILTTDADFRRFPGIRVVDLDGPLRAAAD